MNAETWAFQIGLTHKEHEDFDAILAIALPNYIQKNRLLGFVQIASGSYGKVYQSNYDGVDVAVKMVTEASSEQSASTFTSKMRELKLELRVLVLLRHPNVVGFWSADAPPRPSPPSPCCGTLCDVFVYIMPPFRQPLHLWPSNCVCGRVWHLPPSKSRPTITSAALQLLGPAWGIASAPYGSSCIFGPRGCCGSGPCCVGGVTQPHRPGGSREPCLWVVPVALVSRGRRHPAASSWGLWGWGLGVGVQGLERFGLGLGGAWATPRDLCLGSIGFRV